MSGRAAVRAIALLTACALLVACARVPPENGRAPVRHAWTRPGVLRLADVADPDSLNPLLSTMDLSYDLSSLMFSYLIVADGRGSLIGDLATAVPSLANGGISRDGRTVTYHLRTGVRWHDGRPLTARDVAFTWRAIMSPRNNVIHREGYEEAVAVDAPDARTVVAHLRRRYPPFVTQFFTTLQEGAKPVLPEHLLGSLASIDAAPFNANPVGSGPFRFVSWKRGEKIVMAANAAYYRGRPKLERIELAVVPDANAIVTALSAHEIDMPVSSFPLLYDRFRASAEYRAILTPWNSAQILMLNAARPALAHAEVRRAVARAIDYRALIDKLTYGSGTFARDIIPPAAIGYVERPAYAYDPKAAAGLLERAGWRAGADGVRERAGTRLDLTFVVDSGGPSTAFAVQLQAMLRDVGIHVGIKPYPYHGIYAYDGPIVRGRYDFALFFNTLPYDPDSTSRLGCAQFSPKGENEGRFCDPAIDALEAAGLQTDDPAARAAIYRRIGARVRDEVPFIPLYARRRVSVYNSDLRGYDPAPVAAPWWNAWQWSI